MARDSPTVTGTKASDYPQLIFAIVDAVQSKTSLCIALFVSPTELSFLRDQ
jgi:hypothetical protein